MASTGIHWYTGPLNELLKSEHGDVAKYLGKEGEKITNKAKVNLSGSPHGMWGGKRYPSNPGGFPGARTHHLQGSVSWEYDHHGGELCILVGTNLEYGLHLEKRANAPYPWLFPTLRQCGYDPHEI